MFFCKNILKTKQHGVINFFEKSKKWGLLILLGKQDNSGIFKSLQKIFAREMNERGQNRESGERLSVI